MTEAERQELRDKHGKDEGMNLLALNVTLQNMNI